MGLGKRISGMNDNCGDEKALVGRNISILLCIYILSPGPGAIE